MSDSIKNTPLVSVVIPTYKRPDKLTRVLNSVLGQTYQNLEVIVVDDNDPETDARTQTERIMTTYAGNPKVKYIQHEHNKNGSAARNTGVRNSKAKYIAFLDDDDEFYPEKIMAQVKRLEELPEEYAVCYTTVVYEKEDGSISESKEKREGDLFFNALTRELSFQAGSNLFIRKDVFDSIGGFDETFKRSQDKEIVTRLLQKHKIAYAPVKGVHAHIYSNHSFVDPFQTTEYYVSKMQPFVDTLPLNLQMKYKSVINRQLFYYSVVRRKWGFMAKLLLTAKISPAEAFSVIVQGIKRKYFI